ncbi:MAG: hypothetical protein P8163_17280 [Candidatus Thiodiazotropha sp.]
MQVIKQNILISLIVCLMVSCGGGDKQDSEDKEVLNPGLSGKFFMSTNTLLNAAFGDYVEIPDTCDQGLTEEFSQARDTSTYPIQQNGEWFIFVAREGGRSYICVQSFSGDVIFDVELPVEVELVNLSQDGAYLAVTRSSDGESLEADLLEIYTIEGVALGSTSLGSGYSNMSYVYWLRDNRLVYHKGRSFFITKPALMEVDYQIDLDDYELLPDTGRFINHWAISPDDRRIAFTLTRDLFTTDVIQLLVMDLDGSNLTVQATVTDEGDGYVVFYPLWSPDGEWIFTEVGIQPMIKPYKFTYFYLIPANNPDTHYLIDEDDEERSPEIRKVWRKRQVTEYGEEITSEGFWFDWLYWLP